MTCCTPSGGGAAPGLPAGSEPVPAGSGLAAAGMVQDEAAMVAVPGGVALIGEDSSWSYPGDGEGPVRRVAVQGFRMDVGAVTNRRFAAFVVDTGHVTSAERYGWSFVFAGALPDDFPDTRGIAAAPWWRQVPGACWWRPEGGHSDVATRGEHPVVHVGADDAAAFADWAGKRLPTEVEWEHAARGGTETTFPWGDELEPDGQHVANVWQGEFPSRNTCADGWATTCPVEAFGPNAFGLHNMIGNVWEWTADEAADGPGTRVLKGGSYLCHASYCRRYRPAARSSAEIDSSMANSGFRCVTEPARVDGRTARRDRNSDAVLDAVRGLFLDGNYAPTAEAVAVRSGVSLRSVYRYFEDADALVRAAIARSIVLAEPLFVVPDLGEGPLADRIQALVEHRLRLYDALGAEARAAVLRGASAPLVAEQLARRREQLSEQVQLQFAPELRELGTARGRALLACIDVLLQFEALEHLERRVGLSPTQTRRVLVAGITALLAEAA